jgi:hypothetical protein
MILWFVWCREFHDFLSSPVPSGGLAVLALRAVGFALIWPAGPCSDSCATAKIKTRSPDGGDGLPAAATSYRGEVSRSWAVGRRRISLSVICRGRGQKAAVRRPPNRRLDPRACCCTRSWPAGRSSRAAAVRRQCRRPGRMPAALPARHHLLRRRLGCRCRGRTRPHSDSD